MWEIKLEQEEKATIKHVRKARGVRMAGMLLESKRVYATKLSRSYVSSGV